MCGDVDEDAGELAQQLYAGFLAHARALLQPQAHAEGAPSVAYMEKLFADALGRSTRDAEEAGADQRHGRLADQALVFARLAGVLAGHLGLEQDPLRKVIEALMHGYAEAEAAQAGHDHDHSHSHDHDHDHDHGHHH